MNWTNMTTEERRAAVRARVEDGQTYGQVAAALGTTRNSIAGIVDRADQPIKRPRIVGGAVKAIQDSARKARNHFAFGEIAPSPHPVPPDDKPLKSAAWLALPGTTPVALEHLMGCHWPIGPDTQPYSFCNEACPEGSPYCPTHRAIAYKPAPPMKLNGRRK